MCIHEGRENLLVTHYAYPLNFMIPTISRGKTMCSSLIKLFDHNTYKTRTNIILFSHSYSRCPCDKSHCVWPDDWLTSVILRGPRGCISPSSRGVKYHS